MSHLCGARVDTNTAAVTHQVPKRPDPDDLLRSHLSGTVVPHATPLNLEHLSYERAVRGRVRLVVSNGWPTPDSGRDPDTGKDLWTSPLEHKLPFGVLSPRTTRTQLSARRH